MVSVILPTCDEGCNPRFEMIVRNILEQEGEKEVIIIERGETEQTEVLVKKISEFQSKVPFDKLRAGKSQKSKELEINKIKFFHVPGKNRAQAMNFGLKKAKGDIVLFHHPASLLPEKIALKTIKKSFQDSQIVGGGFQHSFFENHWMLRCISWYSNHVRAQRKKILYLDHCVFCRTAIAKEIGGFPEIDIFEDTEFSKNLRKKGKMILLNQTLKTSGHKYINRGILKHWFQNQVLKFLFFLGVSTERLNKWYGRTDSF